MRAIVLLLIYFTLTSLATACNDDLPPQPENFTRICLEPWERNRSYAISTRSEIGRLLSTSASAVSALQTILSHFDRTGKLTQSLYANPAPSFYFPKQRACTLAPAQSSVDIVTKKLSRYGYGRLNTTCTTEHSLRLRPEEVRAIHTYSDAIAAIARPAARRLLNKDWPNAQPYDTFRYRDSVETCTLNHLVAYRTRGVWGLNTGFTNIAPTLSVNDRGRRYLLEILHIHNNAITPLRVTLPRRPPATGWLLDAATVLEEWGGRPESSMFRTPASVRDNAAMTAARQCGRDAREQVEDATTASSVAIMSIPLIFATVPIAALADVAPAATALYAIATDVVTALPLMIKGFELMRFAQLEHTASRTWVYGGTTLDDIAVAETWHAECSAESRILVKGRIFVSVALVGMMLGCALEIVFLLKLRRSKFHAKAGRGCCSCPKREMIGVNLERYSFG